MSDPVIYCLYRGNDMMEACATQAVADAAKVHFEKREAELCASDPERSPRVFMILPLGVVQKPKWSWAK